MHKYHSILKLLSTILLFVSASAFTTLNNHPVFHLNNPAADTFFRVNNTIVEASIHLPADYYRSKKDYPVMYLLSPAGNTRVFSNDISDSLQKIRSAGTTETIILEIAGLKDSVLNDITEPQFSEFIVKELKPFVDKNYRTSSSSENTIIAGFHSTALSALAISLKYSSVFGRSGIFAADFTDDTSIVHTIRSNSSAHNGMMFIHSFEGDESVNGIKIHRLVDELAGNSSGYLYNFLDSGESASVNLKPAFIEFYKWILSNGHSYIVPVQSGKTQKKRS